MIIITLVIIVGNFQKAEKLFEKLLNRYRAKKGENDPLTLHSMHDLAVAYDRQGRHNEAEVLLKQCLDKKKLVLGESHHHTLCTMNSIATIYDNQGPYCASGVRVCVFQLILLITTITNPNPSTRLLSLLLLFM